MFQLTDEEWKNLRSQFATLAKIQENINLMLLQSMEF